ncbi:MAG: anti-sigma factor [Micropruina sp.]|uniref:anti-sigma factor n=1 Tax=Micropruina sp. TaxID=2737536 RepID=UPI0039E4C13B
MDEVHDLIGAYAVDALEPDEQAAFELHLRHCASCQDELAGFGDALAELSADYQVAPPPVLRAAVLDAVAELPAPTPAVPSEDAEPAEGTAANPGEAAPLPRRAIAEPGQPDELAIAPVTALRPTPAARRRWQLLVAAAVVLIAALGISVWQPWVPRAITAADVLAAPDAVRATKTMDGGATVTLVRSNQLAKAVLVTRNLPPAPAGKAHQAWLLQPGGAMVSGGMMPADADVTMLLEGDARDTVGAGISVEPPGGSAKPNLAGAIVVEL